MATENPNLNNNVGDSSTTDHGGKKVSAETPNTVKSSQDSYDTSVLDEDLKEMWNSMDWTNPVRSGLFGLRRRNKQEEIDLAKSKTWNELLMKQNERTYNSEAMKNARLRAAGINPDITGGESLANASEMSESEDFGSLGDMTGPNAYSSQVFDQISRTIAQIGTTALGCVQLGNALSVTDTSTISGISKLLSWSDDKGYDLLGFKTEANGEKIMKKFDDLSEEEKKEFADANMLEPSSVTADAYTKNHRKFIEGRINRLFVSPSYRRAAMNYYDNVVRDSNPTRKANDIRRSSGILSDELDSANNASILQQFGISPQSNLPGMTGVLDTAGTSEIFRLSGEAKKLEISNSLEMMKINADELEELSKLEPDADGKEVSYGKVLAIKKKYDSMRAVAKSKFQLDEGNSYLKMLTTLENRLEDLRKAGKTNSPDYKYYSYAYIAALSGEFGDFTNGGNLYNTLYPDDVGMSPHFRNFGHAADVVGRILNLVSGAASTGGSVLKAVK